MDQKPKRTKTKDKLLDVAQVLFLNRGFSATSVDEICRKAAVTKGGFFYYFKSKEDLGKAVLNRFCETSKSYMLEVGCCKKRPDPLERVFANLDCVVDYTKGSANYKGCLIVTFAQEMSGSHPEIQAICSDGLKAWAKVLKSKTLSVLYLTLLALGVALIAVGAKNQGDAPSHTHHGSARQEHPRSGDRAVRSVAR